MQIQRLGTTDPQKTVAAMAAMRDKFYTDVAFFAFMDLQQFFDFVKNMPYKMEDPFLGMQILQRPKFTLCRKVNVVACANKAILISSYLKLFGIKNGFVISANKAEDNYGHVFNWALFPGRNEITFIDATYPENVLFREKHYAKRKVFK
jgi:hypothetical protein